MKVLLKAFVLVVCWFTFSPLILILGKKWNEGTTLSRTLWMLVSPLFLYLYVAIIFGSYFWCQDYDRHHYFQDRDRIERITGVALPKFKVTSYEEGGRGFTGDYNDFFFFEFKNPLPDELFDELDKKIEAGNTGWRKEGNKYSFSQTWGNGIPAPKGEDENDDRFFNITITRGDKRGVVNHGTW